MAKKLFKTLIVVVLIFATCITSSCSFLRWLGDDWLTKDQKEITDAAMGRLCGAIIDRDGEAVKAEFSYYEISNVKGFEEEARKLLNYIKGENVSFIRRASGSESAAMGSYPKEREFNGVRYDIETSTDSYKVVFGYRSYYSEGVNRITEEKIGFTYLDIINVKNDRICPDRLYSGCPFNYMGINFDYKTNYIFCPEEYGFNIAYCGDSCAFEPLIINGVADLNAFYEDNKDEYFLDSRVDGKGFIQVMENYDEAFFEECSLYIAGVSGDGIKYNYVPQFIYVGDFVLANVVCFAYDGGDSGNYTQSGVILFVELPEKVENSVHAILDLSHHN